MKYSILLFIRQIISRLRTDKNGNTVILIKENGKKVYKPRIKGLNIKGKGKNNRLVIYAPYIINKLDIEFSGNNANIKIGKKFRLYQDSIIFTEDNVSILINKNVSMQKTRLYAVEGNITIGKNCMMSYDIEIRTSDHHTIYDIDSGELLNPPGDINIGEHCWICQGVLILKKVTIPNNTVIGANTFVNKEFTEENCILVGTPARICKRNTNWKGKLPTDYLKLINNQK